MKLLVANRGEIAVRIFRTAGAMGYGTVAVHSTADADAPHVRAADEAVQIGLPAPRESYLNIPAIIDAARRTSANFIHPGYGFLAENAAFAAACAEAGLTFVGPSAEVIELMGDKAAAKQRMAVAGVPLLEGYNGVDQSNAKLAAEAQRIGFPLMVKAVAGGGGKGMRLVRTQADLADALAAARREALAAFGSDTLILERALMAPRHVEIQIMADSYGHVIALGERDCSVQRRHQKVVEEAPSPALDHALRARMFDAAVKAATDIGYVGAGTVEFLLDEDGSFAFLEMNTRLQVEHPVTELTTGLDLVEWQLRVAAGERLTIEQDDVSLNGHAMEVRLYAEGADFNPSAGRIEQWIAPTGMGVRVDAGIASGFEVGTYYDPMLAKIIAHGANREEARRRLVAALERSAALGITTNRAFLIEILKDPRFVSGQFSTAFLDNHRPRVAPPDAAHIAGAALALHHEREQRAQRRSPGLAGWSNNGVQATSMRFSGSDAMHEVRITRDRDGVTVNVDGCAIESAVVPTTFWTDGHRVLATFLGTDLDLADTTLSPPASPEETGSGILRSPFFGLVGTVFVKEGDPVEVGDKLLTLEAMKMEHLIAADVTGTIDTIIVRGTQVAANELLARIQKEKVNA